MKSFLLGKVPPLHSLLLEGLWSMLRFKVKTPDMLERGYITQIVVCNVNKSLEDVPYFTFQTAIDFTQGAYNMTGQTLHALTENALNMHDLII